MFFDIKSFISHTNQIFTLLIVFPGIILIGTFLTLKLKCLQITKLPLSLRYLMAKRTVREGGISHYQAVAGILAGNFGTGNISGMAVALTTGGPGALVWMWVMAFFGSAIQYASCNLATKFRRQDEHGFSGGPMYYLRDGLNKKHLAKIFALASIAGSITCGNFVQINSVALPLANYGINPLYVAIGTSIVLGLIIVGGIKRFALIASTLVPLMAFAYLIAAVWILVLNHSKIPGALEQILHAAFNWSSLTGGVLGFGFFKALTTGFDRGLFATDAGTGLVPVIQATADSQHPVISGVVTILTPFIVMILCTITALVLMVTDVWTQSGLLGTDLCAFAFEKGLSAHWGGAIVIIALFLFAITTILAWSVCAEKAVQFLWGSRFIGHFRYFYISIIPIGALMNVDLAWMIADLSISAMLLTNMVGVIGLSSNVIEESRNFFSSKTRTQKI